MKKIIVFLLVLFTISLFAAAAPAGGGIRVDLVSGQFITEASADNSVHVGRRKRRVKNKDIHDIFYSKTDLSGEWSKMDISFTPVRDERVSLTLRGISGGVKDIYPFLHVDALTITGAELKNTGFEKLTKSKKFANWGGYSFQVTKDVKEGKFAARISYNKVLAQNIHVKKGVPVKISLYARQENPLIVDRGKDGMTNRYTDNSTGTQVLISTGRIMLVPNFENCSYYINRTKKEWGKKCSVKVYYREKGASKWISVLDPVNMEREKAWRGSIMLLQENTEYEFKAVISGDVKDEILKTFRTRSSNFKVAETIVLNSKNFKGQLKNIKSGTPDGYIRYTAEKGFVLKGGKNMDRGVIDFTNGKYVIFENMVIDANGSRHGIALRNCSDVIVRNCEISNFGRSDWVRDMTQLGRWTFKGSQTGWDGGINIHGGQRHLIERCYIHTPHSSSNSWFYSHPTGPEAIFIDKTRGGTVIRYNDLIGSDSRRWNDTIESSGNGQIDGGFGRDSDIYGNFFAYANDDSIEIEGGEMNVRVYYNRFQGSYCGVSTGCCRLGPSYQFRNVYYRLGDENNRRGINFKNGMGNQGDGAIFIMNNSTYTPGIATGYGNFHGKNPVYNPPLKAFTRNNIVIASGKYVAKEWKKWNCDLDKDLFFGADKETEMESKQFFKEWKQYKNAIFADPGYVDAENGDLRLKKDSPARNKAARIPGLPVKHLGAYQDDGIEIPFRPLPVFIDRKEIRFTPGNKTESFTFTLEAKGKNFAGAFKVRCNDDFFTVSPVEGKIKSGEKIRFTVRCNNSKIKMPRIHNGMILVRFDNGLSRALSVFADFRSDKALQKEVYKHAAKVKDLKFANNVYTGKVTIPEDGCYFVFAEGKLQGWGRTKVKIGDVATDRRARFISKVPGIACVRNGHLSGWYFFLKKGEHDFSLTTDLKDAQVTGFYVTKEAEWFLR